MVTVENVLRPLALAWRFEFYKASVSVSLSLSRILSLLPSGSLSFCLHSDD